MRLVAVASPFLALVIAGPSASAGYTAIDLYTLAVPPGYDYSVNGAAGGQLVGARGPHAFLWNSSGAPVDLNPAGAQVSLLTGTNGIQQVGEVDDHAFLWTGTRDSAVDLNPAPGARSVAYATNGTQQVGEVSNPTRGHATIWSGNASSAVDLNPVGSSFSGAFGTDGVHQVGYVSADSLGAIHASIWSGTADSVVDLSPANLASNTSTYALGVGGDQQVGWAAIALTRHAFLWRGTGQSAVDLNPAEAIDSVAYATNGIQQVGSMQQPGMGEHAVVWSGSADAAIDLNSLLPGRWTYSMAYSIDADGNIFGTGFDSTGQTHAIEWENVPEPVSAALLLVGAPVLVRRRHSA